MYLRRINSYVLLAAIASALAASGAAAQATPPEPVRPDQVQPDPVRIIRLAPEAETTREFDRQERLDALRAELQRVYERLFELQVSYQRSGDDAAVLDSLALERQVLRGQVDELSLRIAEENELREDTEFAPPRRGEADIYVLFEQLAHLEDGMDPEEIGRIFDDREGLGQVLAIIGEQLKDMEVDITEDRVRIETGTGGKLSFTVPEELREELSAGMREIGRELNRTLSDSTGGARDWARIVDGLPGRIAEGWPERSGRRRKVVAESAFSVGRDFEVGANEIVQGDVLLIGGDAYVSGEVQGSVYVLFGDLLIEEQGLIAEDAISAGGRVLLHDQAEVLGRRLDFGDLGGLAGGDLRGGLAWALYAGRLVVLLAMLLLIYALFGERMAILVDFGGAQPGRAMASGALWFTMIFGVFVVAAVGLAVSVIGIPVVLVLAAGMGLVCMMAYLAGCELVGRRLFVLFRPDAEPVTGWIGAVLGVALLELPAIVLLGLGAAGVDAIVTRPLTALELVVRFLALSIGFGAVVQTRLGRRGPEGEEVGPAGDVVSASA
ncbi:hypothetical protein DRQ53_02655 [bacterium]|nr:MAG: hypothetical protein DRQ53_02655 [bacterium]